MHQLFENQEALLKASRELDMYVLRRQRESQQTSECPPRPRLLAEILNEYDLSHIQSCDSCQAVLGKQRFAVIQRGYHRILLAVQASHCPYCASVGRHLVHRPTFTERIGNLFGYSTYRCDSCLHRYKSWNGPISTMIGRLIEPTSKPEHRAYFAK